MQVETIRQRVYKSLSVYMFSGSNIVLLLFWLLYCLLLLSIAS